jgi:hypothetical protein
MKRVFTVLAVAIVMALMLVAGPASMAFAAEHHPPKFGVQSTQCTGDANQPNCPGSH